MVLNESFSQRIKKLRESRNISQQEIAKALGVKVATIDAMENDRAKISIERARMLAVFFDVSLEYLVGESKNPR